MDDQVTALLQRAADVGGEFVPPDVAALATRGRRRTLTRTALAVAAVIVLVVGLAVGLQLVGGGSTRPIAQTSSVPPGPSLSALEHGRWSTLPRAPLVPRGAAATVWTGTQLLIWGGSRNVRGSHIHDFADGAAYTPATHTWSVLPKSPLSPRGGSATVWTGSVLFIWGGYPAHGSQQTNGATYNPRTHRWRLLPPAPIAAYGARAAVSVDGKVVLVTSHPGDTTTIHAIEYDPATNEWVLLSNLALPAGHDLGDVAVLTAGDRVLVWSLWAHTTPAGQGGVFIKSGTDGYALDLVKRSWTPAPIRADHGTDVGTPLWTGSRVLLLGIGPWCGSCSHPGPSGFHGVSIDPVTGARMQMAARPLGVNFLSFAWTGSFVLGFDERYHKPNAHPATTAAWDAQRNTWTDLPSPSHDVDFQAVLWIGHELLALTTDGALLQFVPR